MGVLWDYCCLPQKPHAGKEEKARFKAGLATINRWARARGVKGEALRLFLTVNVFLLSRKVNGW